MTDPRERELLAKFLGVAVVGLDVDRPLEEERFVETVPACLGSPSQLGSNNCSFRTESRSTEIGLLSPAQLHRPSATYGKSEPISEGLVDQTFTSWNHVIEWVKRLEALERSP